VPTSPPGWWAKQQAGKKVATTKLPRLKAGISDRIAITGGELRHEPEMLAAAREKSRIIASSGVAAALTAPVSTPTHHERIWEDG